jgi:polyphosphate kinase 2
MSKKRAQYEEHLRPMQVELNQVQRWLLATGKRLLVLFEGRDTAGKGGAINVFTQCLNPRTCRVVALPKPNERERTQWYFQRYIAHLPAAGEIVLFDRSWYNRAGVEHVMGFCTGEEYQRFFEQVNVFEKLLVDDGILLMKYWFGCDQEAQEERFRERIEDPVKRWKISPIDLAARDKYEAYSKARDVMFARTHTDYAPWYAVDMNDQRLGRLNMVRHLLDHLPDHDIPPPPIEMPELSGKLAKERFGKHCQPVPVRYRWSAAEDVGDKKKHKKAKS